MTTAGRGEEEDFLALAHGDTGGAKICTALLCRSPYDAAAAARRCPPWEAAWRRRSLSRRRRGRRPSISSSTGSISTRCRVPWLAGRRVPKPRSLSLHANPCPRSAMPAGGGTGSGNGGTAAGGGGKEGGKKKNKDGGVGKESKEAAGGAAAAEDESATGASASAASQSAAPQFTVSVPNQEQMFELLMGGELLQRPTPFPPLIPPSKLGAGAGTRGGETEAALLAKHADEEEKAAIAAAVARAERRRPTGKRARAAAADRAAGRRGLPCARVSSVEGGASEHRGGPREEQ